MRATCRRTYDTPPLSTWQKRLIESWARNGKRDREIADFLDITTYQVETYRTSVGIKGANRGGAYQPLSDCRDLRPSHVKGEVGSDEWFASSDEAFQRAVHAAGGW